MIGSGSSEFQTAFDWIEHVSAQAFCLRRIKFPATGFVVCLDDERSAGEFRLQIPRRIQIVVSENVGHDDEESRVNSVHSRPWTVYRTLVYLLLQVIDKIPEMIRPERADIIRLDAAHKVRQRIRILFEQSRMPGMQDCSFTSKPFSASWRQQTPCNYSRPVSRRQILQRPVLFVCLPL